MLSEINGIHHVTSIASEPRQNDAFFSKILGLRQLKKTVNFDNSSVYHLYFGDQIGTPGTIMTYFPFLDRKRGTRGLGEVGVVNFAVKKSSIAFWREHFAVSGATYIYQRELFEEQRLDFCGPDGEQLALTEVDHPTLPKGSGPIQPEAAIHGFHSAHLTVASSSKVVDILEQIGYQVLSHDGDITRFHLPTKSGANLLDVHFCDGCPQAQEGAGSVHHIAFSASDDAAHLRVSEALIRLGHPVTPVKDHTYFKAIYFGTPDGILFEVATNPLGFTIDEAVGSLGQGLRFPPQHEHLRSELENSL